MSDVSRIHDELANLLAVVAANGEPSDLTAAEVIATKALLLSAASHFERELCDLILQLASEGGTPRLYLNFIHKQALERRYHTMFSWDATNLNKFFSLFGDEAKQSLSVLAKSDDVHSSISDFIFINSKRNELVHQNFAGYSLDATFADVWKKYENARGFSAWLKQNLGGLGGATVTT
jgi:hypothetical protein